MAELSQAQKRAVAKESWWYWYYHGTLVHRATANKLREQYPGRFVYQPIGVDFFDKLTSTWGELTTPGRIAVHKRRGGDYETRKYATYEQAPGKKKT